MKIFAINPGTTSTKIALYEDCSEIWSETFIYQYDEIASFNELYEQEGFRYGDILKAIKQHNVNLSEVDVVVGRGGLLHPITSGTWIINEPMIADLRSNKYGVHASSLGAILALRLAKEAGGRPAYIVDPVCVDEMSAVAHISGIPDMPRKAIFHALNQRAVAYRVAEEIGKPINKCRFIVAHMGGGVSVGAHCEGRVIDVNDALGGYGPMSADRAGTVHAIDIIKRCFSGKYTETEMKKQIIGNAGLAAHLGTNDFKKITGMAKSGDEKAKLIVDAIAYQIAGEIGARSVAMFGRVDAIILTGGLSNSESFCELVTKRVSWIAKVVRVQGEDELKALAEGAYRVITGREEAHEYEQE